MINDEKDLENYGIYPNYSKPDPDLYKDEDNVINRIIQIKRSKYKNLEEWIIIDNKTTALIISSKKLNNKEKEFLRTVDGIIFLISKYKEGCNSFNKLKQELKKI